MHKRPTVCQPGRTSQLIGGSLPPSVRQPLSQKPTEPMSPKQTHPARIQSLLRHAHRGTLGLLAICAVGIAARGLEGPEPPPDQLIGTVAVGLALSSILARRLGTSPVVSGRTAALATLSSLALAGALGPLGVHVAWNLAAPETALLFVLAGTLFSLRRPAAGRAG